MLTNSEGPKRRVFVGRDREIEQFRSALERMRQEFENLRSLAEQVGAEFDPDAAPRDLNYPRLFLLHGIGGIGKTWLTWRFRDIVREEFPTFFPVYVDVSLRPAVTTERELLMRLAAVLADDFPQAVAPFQGDATRQPEVGARVLNYQADHKEFWERSLDIAAQAVAGAANIAAQKKLGVELGDSAEAAVQVGVKGAIRGSGIVIRKAYELFLQRMQDDKQLTADEVRLFSNPDSALAASLAHCLKNIVAQTPLVLALDTIETIVRLEPFIRDDLVLPSASESMIFVIAGRHDLSHERTAEDGSYRNVHKGFADVLPNPPVVIDVGRFAAPEIRTYVREQGNLRGVDLEPDDNLISAIQQTSGGVPLAVEMAVDAVLTMGPARFHADFVMVPDSHVLLPKERIAEVTNRFLRYCIAQQEPDDLEKVYALAILRKGATEGALRAIWTVPDGRAVREELGKLAASYSLMRGNDLHDEVREFVRRRLLTDPALHETRRAFGARAAAHYEIVFRSEASEELDVARRLDDERFAECTCDLLNTLFWADGGHAVSFLARRWIEAYPFARRFCRRLLEIANEFLQVKGFLHERDRATLNLLHQLTPVSPSAADLISELESSENPAVADEPMQRLRRLQHEGEQGGWWEQVHGTILLLSIGQVLARAQQHDRALDYALDAGTAIQTLREQEQLMAKIAELCEELGWSLGYRKIAGSRFSRAIASRRAVQAYEMAVALGRQRGATWRCLSRLYRLLSENDRSLDAALRARDIESNDASNLENLGTAYGAVGRYDEALEAYNNAEEIDPKDSAPSAGRGHIYFMLASYDEAMGEYLRAIELSPTDGTWQYDLGNVYYFLRRYDDALFAYKRAIDLDPQDAESRSALASLYRRLDRLDEAAEQIKLARESISQASDYNRACFESVCNNVEAALALLGVAISKSPRFRELGRQDPDFDFIRQDPRFIALMAG
jgi:tetratricopeptide (TPR) repeat protein